MLVIELVAADASRLTSPPWRDELLESPSAAPAARHVYSHPLSKRHQPQRGDTIQQLTTALEFCRPGALTRRKPLTVRHWPFGRYMLRVERFRPSSFFLHPSTFL